MSGDVRSAHWALEGDDSLKRKGKGRFDVRVEANQNICAVRRCENRAATPTSAFAGWELVQEILQRWNTATNWRSRALKLWVCRTTEITPLVHLHLLARHHSRPDQHLAARKISRKEMLTRRGFVLPRFCSHRGPTLQFIFFFDNLLKHLKEKPPNPILISAPEASFNMEKVENVSF